MPAIDPRNIEVVDPAMAAIYRQKTMAQRVEIMNSANHAMRAMIAAGARALHPQWTEEEVQAEVLRRIFRGPS